MKHPYETLITNLGKYSKILNKEDITQIRPNSFLIEDQDFKILDFLNDVKVSTGIKPQEHQYIGSSCTDPNYCLKPYIVYGFDNVLFYFKNKEVF